MLRKSVLFRNMVLVFGFLILFVSPCMGEPTIEWEKCFGGSEDDGVYSVQQTSDGGYIAAGYSRSADGDVSQHHGDSDAWVIKLKEDGTLDWQRSLGGSGRDTVHSVQQTKDGGYIVAGGSDSKDGDVSGNHGSNDFWVIKLMSDGKIEWQRSLGGSGDDLAWSVQQANDGGYIVAGNSDSQDGDVSGNHGDVDGWVVKLKPDGELEWQKSLGDSGYDRISSIQQTSDGGYVLAGLTSRKRPEKRGSQELWVVKLDSNGSLEWEKYFGGSGADEAQSIRQTSEGGYIVAGSSTSNDGDASGNHGGEKDAKGRIMYYHRDFWVVKLNADGEIEWQRMLGGSQDDWGQAVCQASDGSYIVVGYTRSVDGDVSENHRFEDGWVVKLKVNGILDWQKSLGGSEYDNAYDISQTKDGDYIVAGYSNSSDGDIFEHRYRGRSVWIVKLKGN